MPFSLGSYLLGVGTVLGALAFGFGGGELLTHTATKKSPAEQTRRERFVHAEPGPPAASQAPAAEVNPTLNQAAVAANQGATPDHDHSAGAIKQDARPAEQSVAASPAPISAAPKRETVRKPVPESPRQNQAARERQPPKQVEQTERTEAKPIDSRRTDHAAARSRRYANRRQPDNGTPSMRQRRFMVQEEPEQEAVVSRAPRHFDLFSGFFGRPVDAND